MTKGTRNLSSSTKEKFYSEETIIFVSKLSFKKIFGVLRKVDKSVQLSAFAKYYVLRVVVVYRAVEPPYNRSSKN